MEFLCDYTGYWCRTGHVDLRDGKYKKLRTQQSLALGVDASNGRPFCWISARRFLAYGGWRLTNHMAESPPMWCPCPGG